MLIKSFTHEIASREEFHMVKITEQVKKDVEESGVKNGVVFVISLHTTTGIMINESLPCVEKDIELTLERLRSLRCSLCPYPYAAQLRNLQRQCSGAFKIHAVRKSLRPSCCRWKDGRRKRPGYLFRRV